MLLSDGADNSGGIDRDTIAALRNRHIPVHTVGFGQEQVPHDVEINDAVVAPRALADSRLAARVSFHQRGYAGRKSTLTVRDGDKVLAARRDHVGRRRQGPDRKLCCSMPARRERRRCSSPIDPLPGEENRANNSVTRLVNVESDKRRILYVEGEPRWEYKFIRRAEDDDRIVQLVSMLRTTENKIYRQGIDDPKELADGFPTTREDLFSYQALVIGSVEATYFTPPQQDLIQQFVDRRGGGLLLLGGRFALADGGWAASSLADLLPVMLPERKDTFHRDPATAEADAGGRGQHHLPSGGRSGEERRALEEAALPDGLPGPGHAQAGRRGAGGDERRRGRKMPLLITENLRPRAHRRAGHGGHLALADEPAAGRHDARRFLAAIAALAGGGHARARGRVGAEPDAV